MLNTRVGFDHIIYRTFDIGAFSRNVLLMPASVCFIPGDKAVTRYLQGGDKKRSKRRLGKDLPGSSASSQSNQGALSAPASLY